MTAPNMKAELDALHTRFDRNANRLAALRLQVMEMPNGKTALVRQWATAVAKEGGSLAVGDANARTALAVRPFHSINNHPPI